MRNPEYNKTNEVEKTDGSPSVIVIEGMPMCDKEEYDLYDPKDFLAYIRDCKAIIRNSFEYRSFIRFLKDVMEMNNCSFFTHVTNKDTYGVTIEIHHEIFTIEDIIHMVFYKRQELGESLDVLDLAQEVMYLHYIGLVALVPLSTTVHELVHNRYLFIPSDKVFGDYKKFAEFYMPYCKNEDLKINLERIEEATQAYRGDDLYILDQKPVLINTDSLYTLPTYEDIKKLMFDRIAEIKKQELANAPMIYQNMMKQNTIHNDKIQQYCAVAKQMQDDLIKEATIPTEGIVPFKFLYDKDVK